MSLSERPWTMKEVIPKIEEFGYSSEEIKKEILKQCNIENEEIYVKRMQTLGRKQKRNYEMFDKPVEEKKPNDSE